MHNVPGCMQVEVPSSMPACHLPAGVAPQWPRPPCYPHGGPRYEGCAHQALSLGEGVHHVHANCICPGACCMPASFRRAPSCCAAGGAPGSCRHSLLLPLLPLLVPQQHWIDRLIMHLKCATRLLAVCPGSALAVTARPTWVTGPLGSRCTFFTLLHTFALAPTHHRSTTRPLRRTRRG